MLHVEMTFRSSSVWADDRVGKHVFPVEMEKSKILVRRVSATPSRLFVRLEVLR